MNCKQAEELLPLYAGRDLDEKRATLVTEHLQACAACARVADEYRESIQLIEQFATPVFSEVVYAGIRQRVLREIETETKTPSWSQTIASMFRPRLTWAIAGALLIVVSMFAIYLRMNRGNVEPQIANKTPTNIQRSEDNRQANLPPSVNTGVKKQRLVGVRQPQQKRSRDMNIVSAKSSQPDSLPEPTLFPPSHSAAVVDTLRVEIQTKDPQIRIIWFVQSETKPIIPSSKGT